MQGATLSEWYLRAPPQQMLRQVLRLRLQQCAPLLPLCGRPAAPAAAVAEVDAHLAAVAALCSYFDPAAAERQSGLLLVSAWRKLLQQALAPERLLLQMFRLWQMQAQSPTAALVAALLQCIRACVGGEPAQTPQTLRAQLQLLQGYPGFVVLPATSPASAEQCAGDFVLLLRWQYTLEQWQWEQQAPQPALGALWQCLQPSLAVVTRHCRESDWTLASYCNAGLQQALQQLQLLAEFAGNKRELYWLQQHSAVLLDLHLAGRRPAAAVLQQWLHALYRYLQESELPAPARVAEQPALEATVAVLPSAKAELQQWQIRLLQALEACAGDQMAGPERLQRLLYYPGWSLAALGLGESARLFRCAWQVLAQYRHLGRTVPAALLALLRQIAALLDLVAAPPQPALRQDWLRQLLRLWPTGLRDTRLDIALALPHTDSPRLVTLAAVPELLSASFNTLVSVNQACFVPVPLAAAQRQLLVAELALLEKGAAALQVWPLEQLCTLLLAVYAKHDSAGQLPAGDLLWQAHRHLLQMLDEAAAWQQAQRNEALLQQLEQWLAAVADPAPQVCEPAPESLQGLQAQLHSWLQNLAAVVEKPVRLQVSSSGTLPAASVCCQAAAGLKPLLKYLLFDHAADVASRRAGHRPRISSFEIRLSQRGQTLLVEVGEDSQAPAPDACRLQQLQRALPATAGRLECESVRGLGRRLRFTLPAG